MKTKKPIILPRVPSKLIRLAMADLRKVERDKKYEVCMGMWHAPPAKRTGTCLVCLAGSVMAKSFGFKPSQYAYPETFQINKDQLNAIDVFRCGYISMGCDLLGVGRAGLLDRIIPPYKDENGPKPFHAAMNKLADDLEKKGL